MTRWLCVWVGFVVLGVATWHLQDRLTRLEHAKVQEETVKRLILQELVAALLEQAVELKSQAAALKAALPHVSPEYPNGKRRWFQARASADVPRPSPGQSLSETP